MCALRLDTQEALSSAGQLGEAEDNVAQRNRTPVLTAPQEGTGLPGRQLVPGDEIVQPGPLSLYQLHFSGSERSSRAHLGLLLSNRRL